MGRRERSDNEGGSDVGVWEMTGSRRRNSPAGSAIVRRNIRLHRRPV
jgi:hypothetical protein